MRSRLVSASLEVVAAGVVGADGHYDPGRLARVIPVLEAAELCAQGVHEHVCVSLRLPQENIS
jgi:hypothetical protein